MKPGNLVPLAAFILIVTTGCDQNSRESANRVAELERQAADAIAKQRELEQQLAEQQLAAERDAIERERMRIEEDRLEMQRRQSEDAAAEAERIRQRETDLATREGRLLRIESELEDKESTLDQRGAELNERDRELAGREALADAGARDEAPAAPAGDFGLFYDSLSPYGSWFETADYGYVWQPVIVRDSSWRPYTRGRWACTDRGWTWISDEPFGWACYHYGRWALCRGYGWVWVPGTEWAPSWVCWRSSGTHIGWAPLPPETLAWRGHRWDSSVEVAFGIGSTWFNFVEIGNFGNPIHYHCLPYTNNDVYIQQTVNITNIHVHNRRVICGGPRYSDVAVQTKRRPPFYRIEEDRHARSGRDATALRPRVSGDRLLVAAPNVDSAWNDAVRPAKVKDRVDQFQIDRKQPLRPEITERFRQAREESRRTAGETIAKLGGEEAFQKARAEQLRQPRVETTLQTRPPAAGKPATTGGPRPVAPRDDMPPAGSDPRVAERLRDSGMRPATPPPPQPGDTTRKPPTRESSRIEESRGEPPAANRPPRPVAPRDDMPPAGSDPKTIERLRDSGMRPAAPRPTAEDPAERIRRNQQQQQEEQAERARRNQQQELQRQREQARQDQAEQARREQQRQQQVEQQQRARQQQEQMERAREQHERARQQQEQQERAREQQERARQQQEQAERAREQQERARQQQEQAERAREQQERARQQQEQQERGRQEEERRGRIR